MEQLEYCGYKGRLVHEDGDWHGKVMNVERLVTFGGLTKELAEQNFEKVVSEYIEEQQM